MRVDRDGCIYKTNNKMEPIGTPLAYLLKSKAKKGLFGSLPERKHDGNPRRTVLMKKTKDKAVKRDKDSGIICGTLHNIQDAYREVDAGMQVVWTSAGFWALPRKE